MALTEFTNLYEILIRFDETGAFAGAHSQHLAGIQRDGVTIQATPQPARPLSRLAAPDRATVADVIGEATVALIEAREAAETKVREHEATIAAKNAELAAAEARAADYAGQLAAIALASPAPAPVK